MYSQPGEGGWCIPDKVPRGLHLGKEWHIRDCERQHQGSGWPLIPAERCNGLVGIIPEAGRKLSPTAKGYTGAVPGPCDEESCLAKGLVPQEQNEKNLWLRHWRPSGFPPDVKTVNITLRFSLGPIPQLSLRGKSSNSFLKYLFNFIYFLGCARS